jgi:hypothetical protein
MSTAITTVPVVHDPALAEQLEPIALKIELLETTAVLQIAREAAKIHEIFRYRRDEGGYTGYMKRRLGYSSSGAYRLLNVNMRFGENPSQNLGKIPRTALFQLAEPATPKEAVDEVAARIEAGEKLTCMKVTEVIAKAKGDDHQTANAGEQVFQEDVKKAIAGKRKKNGDTNDTEASAEQRRSYYAAADAEPDQPITHGDEVHHGVPAAGGGRDQGDLRAAGAEQNGDAAAEPDPAALAGAHHDQHHADEQAVSPEALVTNIAYVALEQFFAHASGAEILQRIPAARRKEVVSALFDALGANGVLEAASDEFKQQLCTKVPTNPNAWLVNTDAGTIARKIADTAGMTKADAVRTHLLNLAVPKRRVGKSVDSEVAAKGGAPDKPKYQEAVDGEDRRRSGKHHSRA